MGYEALRERPLARQKQMGIVPAGTGLPPHNPIGTPEARQGPDGQPFPPLDYTRPWDSLTAEKRLFARMAVSPGFLAHADRRLGRLLDYLEESGQRENTMIIVVSRTTGRARQPDERIVNENKVANGIPDDMQANLAMLDELGGTKSTTAPQRVGDGVQHAVECGSGMSSTGAPPTRASSPGPRPRPEPRRAGANCGRRLPPRHRRGADHP